MPNILVCQKFVLSLQRVTEVIAAKDTKNNGGSQREHAPKILKTKVKGHGRD